MMLSAILRTQATNCHLLALSCLAIAAFSVGISTTATSISFMFAFFFALLSGRWWFTFPYIRQHWGLLSFWILFAWYVIGLSFTVSPPAEAWRDLQKMHWLLMTPFFAVLFDEEVWRRRILNAFMAAMVLTLVLSYLKLFKFPLPTVLYKTSANNVFFEHIVQTFFLNIALFIAGYRWLFERSYRFFYLGFAILATLHVFLFNDCLTGFITYAILFTYLLKLRFGYRSLTISAITAIALLGIALSQSPLVKQRLTTLQQQYHAYQVGKTITSVGLRLSMWENAQALLEHAPWYGYGTGGLKAAMQQTLQEKQIARTGLLDYVEYTPMNFLLQFGILGLATFLTVIWLQISACYKLPNPYRVLMLGFLLAYLAGSLINSFFISFCETHWYALMAAVCFSSASIHPQCEKTYAQSAVAHPH